MIKKYFEEKNLTYSFYHFPMYGHNFFSGIISKFLRGDLGSIDEVDPQFIAIQYAMDRYKFMPELEKELNNKDVVLLDRYVYSNVAFQCAKVDDMFERVKLKKFIQEFEFNFLKLPYPDINIFFDVPMVSIRDRLEVRNQIEDRDYLKGKTDIHEADLDFQDRVRTEYLKAMTGTSNCKTIECSGLNPENVFNTYKSIVDEVLNRVSPKDINDILCKQSINNY
jgi:dTMP kinase